MTKNSRLGIEIRSVIVDGITHEQTWPDAGELTLNKHNIRSLIPLAANSSLKKRKDEKNFIPYSSNILHKGRNELKVFVRRIKAREHKKCNPNSIHVMTVVLVEQKTVQELVQYVMKESRLERKVCK